MAAADRAGGADLAPRRVRPPARSHPGPGARRRRRRQVAAASSAASGVGSGGGAKGAHTVVAGPDGTLLRSGVATPSLATAGKGDVLAGVIGALLAAGCSPLFAAGCGVALHGTAGCRQERIGRSGVIAGDIASLLPEAAERRTERPA